MDPRVTEFHCIMPIDNVPSVMQHGILSHERAARLQHHSVAMSEIQERRDHKNVPGGLKLHQYANLYFHARNPMMFKRQDDAPGLCILRVSFDVIGVQGVVFSDCNASTDYVRFLDPSQWSLLNFDDIYAMDWRHPGDPVAYRRHRSRKCAEVLFCPIALSRDDYSGRMSWTKRRRSGWRMLGSGSRLRLIPCYFFAEECRISPCSKH